MRNAADILFNYLHDVIYSPANAALDVEKLPEEFRDLGSGLRYFAECAIEAKVLAQALSKGNLNVEMPPRDNEIAAPLKALHASLMHLTWQAQQIARGDYDQRVNFMGEFSIAFNAMAQQLNERRQLDIQEKSKLQRYIKLMLSNTPNILLLFDSEGNAVLSSESYSLCSKRSSDDIQGKSFTELFSPVSTDEFLQKMDILFNTVRTTKSTATVEQEIDFEQNGSLRTYLLYVTPIFYENETYMGTMTIFDDITEIIRARKSAEQSARAKSDFLARMSHEMRTPMNAIIGMTSIGKSSVDIEKKDYSFDKIGDASTHLLGVINDILDISKIEADKIELLYGEFSFQHMLDQARNIIGPLASKKKQRFLIDVDESVPLYIVSDEQRLSQVLVNLLSNAVKFTPKHGSISLTAKKISETNGSYAIRFTVCDTGIGISEEDQKRLFTPFEQADGGSSRRFGGTGLGLAISKSIINMMGGNIWIESEPGKGSSFIFEIEVRAGTGTNEDPGIKKENISIDGIFTGKSILIAEDVDINREIIAALLEDTGIVISFAFNGAEAVEKFLAAPDAYELILMDIQMPFMDGYEATARIRSSGLPGADSIPIIAMTANVLREDIERSISSGMNGHLGKPIDINEVINKLKEYL